MLTQLRGKRVKNFADWSIRYKLLTLLLLLGMATFAATVTIAYLKNLGAVKQNVTNQLTGVCRSKGSEIESYYRTIHNHVLTLSEDQMFIEAMREFSTSYQRLDAKPVPPEVLNAVFEDYRSRFYPEMQKLNLARPRVEDYFPVTPAAFHLQYEYIVKNPYPPGRRRELKSAADGSDYSRVHAKYHRALRRIVEKFGYYDLYLIDSRSGRVVYDVNKDRDFATSLQNGPYRESNLAKVMKQCLASNNPDDVFFSDFEPYEASFGEPTQWVASDIFDGDERLGILALQLSHDAIDDAATGNRGWQRDGLGQSGESHIFGPDYLLRTDVRPFLEEPEVFLAGLKSNGFPEEKISRIRTYKTTILQVEARAPSVTAALQGKDGTAIEGSLFGPALRLVSYMPLHIQGLHWVIESQMSLDEALKPVDEMRRLFSWWGGALLVLTVMAALLMTRQILRPIDALVGAVRKVAAGDLTAQVEWKWKDELGMLSDTFNSMTKSIREKTELIEQKNEENERLLRNILPGVIAERLKHGEKSIADGFAEVTVLFADVVGFTAFSSRTPAAELVSLLNDLFSRFDAASQRLGIEKIKTIGDCYMAVCGLPTPRPDHARVMMQMALDMLRAVAEFNRDHGTHLQIRIGLNSGPVVAGVIGSIKFIYDLWGDTVNLASRMESTGVPGAIQITESVYRELGGEYKFEERGLIEVKGKGKLPAWILREEEVPTEASVPVKA
jgi:class 3 adenylate cyclase